MELKIRRAEKADIPEIGRILHAAFTSIADLHNFPCDFPSAAVGVQRATVLVQAPGFYGVVAERDGLIVGSNFLREQDPVRAIGPISVDPVVQERGIGRKLMAAAMERAQGAVALRLVQDAFNTLSMPLYASLGFDPVEPLVLISGRPRSSAPSDAVRPLAEGDVERCSALYRRVHGFDRAGELRDAVRYGKPFVLMRGGNIRAYAASLTNWGAAHGVAESEDDMRALILGGAAAVSRPLSLLLPIREASLFRWLLAEGLRVVKPMTLMAMGEYHEPRASWFPSVLY